MKATLRAFSLMEVLIVIAIVAIMSGFLYPSYTQHLLKQHRVAAETTLLQLASAMETYFTSHHTYQGATLEGLTFSATTAEGTYQLVLEVTDDMHYVLSALPLATQTKDVACGTLVLTAQGEKSATGVEGSVACW